MDLEDLWLLKGEGMTTGDGYGCMCMLNVEFMEGENRC